MNGTVILECGKYSLSCAGSDDKLHEAGRVSKHHYSSLGGNDMFGSGNGIDFSAQRALFL